ncbi:Ethanolamine ammonia-lyase [Gordonia bronchialis DSM 43247]|uniref:Ethanolamine ammonia-lyase small subunit n=1 Tax=Gordonia bronchialis (strain ATCC 25592 / DSM 43247 / BCRC 13721 / JCM 3198 / KCTC 3076 / NBRC 16047 / NCTC 10667) TaxID=526226 RepID=D0L9X6_GORB4|nr:ethanolamine ammonia-lyase subunit EutC [Gordonia bronchialis]ACY22141.1 Ethanolamine ammonia-lyase [Gordonia bronchialis DSM 43247]MCC3324931.1 ethanolamine ammonia-lyase subunit EutC [Gordonia bronchialis]QGS24304.1 ethanolamine ammonia-lyase subunit EutC [Gordonia bronchialis]UAK39497.1 ethanolamine ammonia-lyase subunit EutC [Gordonia bronchialis]STQ65065.1 Ethanolamine ammonia-lyase light chain [Gordonia bronchialis]
MSEPTRSADVWADLRRTTQARIGLGRAGNSLPTQRVLEFQAAHAAARDAVHDPLDVPAFIAHLEDLGIESPRHVRSRADSRGEYLRRPDLGRAPADLSELPRTDADIGIVLADGLSPRALVDHGRGMLAALVDTLGPRYRIAPPVVATQARVALGDHIGEALGVTTLIVVIGERPGLSVADSLGIYLTHRPRPGRTDADRNCISNIHPPDGLGYAAAADITARLVAGARDLGRSGVELKDTSRAAIDAAETTVIEG